MLRYKMESAHPRDILIVEDDVSLLEAVERAFREAGENVVGCSTFEQGREALRTQFFDVVLTDVRLGAFNGLQLALIARDLHPTTQVIVYSGFSDPVLQAEAERVGATYLVKPVGSAELLRMIRACPRTEETR
jgi:DNA-binding NtrC family response regulator